MTRRFVENGARWGVASLLALALCGCGDAAVRKLAGTYVRSHDESGPDGSVHSRTALTLRPDHHWTSASELVINGHDELAGGRARDEIIPPSYTDSGTFALQGVMLAVNSARDGVSHYTVSGDTLWIRGAAMSALATRVTGVEIHNSGDDSEGFLVRQH
jgi:hypothetical protein